MGAVGGGIQTPRCVLYGNVSILYRGQVPRTYSTIVWFLVFGTAQIQLSFELWSGPTTKYRAVKNALIELHDEPNTSFLLVVFKCLTVLAYTHYFGVL